MQFEPKTGVEAWGYRAGFLFSYLLATTILTTLYALRKHLWQYWTQSFAYFAVVVFIVLLVGLAVKRLLR